MTTPARHRLDPPPTEWLLNLKYGAGKQLETRRQHAPFTVRWTNDQLLITLSSSSSYSMTLLEFGDSWKRIAANRRISATKLGWLGSYVLAIHHDLHQPIAADAPPRETWRVYAIELAEGVRLPRSAARKNNGGRDRSKPCLYVGSTKKSSDSALGFGLRPLPELCDHVNPLTTEDDAVNAEQKLADDLRCEGFAVDSGGKGKISDALSKYPRKTTTSRPVDKAPKERRVR